MEKRKYPSRRSVVYAPSGMVATAQHLAAQAGLDILRRGGNAIDAAIATAMTLTIVEPCSNGLGGDLFALVWSEGKLHGLNSSGRSPMAISREAVAALGHTKMPAYGSIPVTVPGIPGGWAELSRRFGSLPMETLAESAIRYAEEGYIVSSAVASMWSLAAKTYRKLRDCPGIDTWFSTYTRNGECPSAGALWRLPDHAKSLREIARTNAESFYRGEIAEKIDAYFRKIGGFLRKEDLAAFKPEWVDPIRVSYRGLDIWEIPPNGQGIVALMALNILKGYDFSSREDERAYHYQLEAIKLAFADAKEYVTDPGHMRVSAQELLDESFARKRRALIGERAQVPMPGKPSGSDTVYLCSADRFGNMVSLIQSNYSGFGCGIVVPETGIALQNRGSDFSLDPSAANALEPGKRTYHTIIPGFITENGSPVGPFGCMGGYMQPQGHVQLVMNLRDFGLDIQQAIDAPRWQWRKGNESWLEPGVSPDILAALRARGHDISYSDLWYSFGRAQIISRLPGGGYMGATEPRADGAALGY